MKRTPLTRRKSLRSAKPLPGASEPMKRSPVSRRNSERLARVRGDEVYGPLHRFIRTLSCCLNGHHEHGCVGAVAGHHLKSVGSGGTDADGEVPVCLRAHREVETIGRARFEAKYGIDLDAIAAKVARRFSEQAPDSDGEPF